MDALDRIRTTMDLLLEYGYIEWQGSLKDTYFKYLGPDVIDYQNKDMWHLVGENKIISLFQWIHAEIKNRNCGKLLRALDTEV